MSDGWEAAVRAAIARLGGAAVLASEDEASPVVGSVRVFAWREDGRLLGYVASAPVARPALDPVVLRPTDVWARNAPAGRVLSADLSFDAVVSVYGPEPEVTASLDHTLRAAVLRLFRTVRPVALRIDEDSATVHVSSSAAPSSTVVERQVRDLGTLAELASSRGTIGERLLAIALDDPNAAVRERAADVLMQVLAARGPSERARSAAYVAIAEASTPLVRHRRVAAERLMALDPPAAAPVLRRFLEGDAPALRRLALAALTRAPDPDAHDALVRVLPSLDDAEAHEALAALGPIARRASEPALVALLTHRTPALVRAAAALLARHGTDAAVTPLRDAIPRGLGGDRDLRRELERALADVADRNGLGRGQLSLAPPQGGELSHARAEAGALSEPPRDDAAHAPTTADRTPDDET